MLVVCWSGDTSGQILVTLSGRGDIGQAVVSESANQVSDQLSRCGDIGGVDEKTYRKWLWLFVTAISYLEYPVVSFITNRCEFVS